MNQTLSTSTLPLLAWVRSGREEDEEEVEFRRRQYQDRIYCRKGSDQDSMEGAVHQKGMNVEQLIFGEGLATVRVELRWIKSLPQSTRKLRSSSRCHRRSDESAKPSSSLCSSSDTIFQYATQASCFLRLPLENQLPTANSPSWRPPNTIKLGLRRARRPPRDNKTAFSL